MPGPATALESVSQSAAAPVPRRWTLLLPALMGALAVALRLAFLPLIPVPVPTVHDEFSYLLGAETFASGRITNPPHPMWVHFETFHENMLPTYCSKYPPASALFLAIGQKFLGHPWFGVCLTVGLMFAALCWMLEGWVERPYAVGITALAIVSWGLTTYYINSYWGGAIPAFAGALVIGALPRLARRISSGPVLAAAVGIVLLANSRPFDGALTALAAGIILLVWMRRRQQPLGALFSRRAVLPFCLVMIPAFAAMGYYNYRTTGKVTVMPYSVNQQIYAASPFLYIFPPTAEPVYHHDIIRRFWAWDRQFYLDARAHPWAALRESHRFMYGFYFASPFGNAAVVGALVGASIETLFASAIVAVPMLGLLIAKSGKPHYLAAACSGFWILAAIAIRRAVTWKWRRFSIVALVCFLGFSMGHFVEDISDTIADAKLPPKTIATRPLFIQRLEKLGGRHLVLVRYKPNHDVHEDWVFNHADIDASAIVWARDMGPEDNRELLAYYPDRQVWLLEPDVDPMAPHPYAPSPDGVLSKETGAAPHAD